MASVTKHFCDRCDAQVESRSDLNLFTAEIDHEVDKGSSGPRGPVWRRELCKKCTGEVIEGINEVVN